MHSGDLSELGAVNLTDAEREALLEVMQRAKDFDEKAGKKMDGPLEGQLQKWTNPLNGWKPRWLNVDQQQGVLHYYTSEDRKKHPPRGSLHLWGAVIAPSDEDSQTFSVNSANGEVYKLRASDAKERQYWVSRLRNEVERCTSAHGGYNRTPVRVTAAPTTSHSHTSTLTLSPISPTTTSSADKSDLASPTSSLSNTPTRRHSKTKRLAVFSSRSKLMGGSKKTKDRKADLSQDLEDGAVLPGGETMLEILTRLQRYQESLTSQLESCSGTGVESVDQNVLLLKATSQAAVHSVKDCLALLRLQQQQQQSSTAASGSSSTTANSFSTGTMSYQQLISEESLVEKRLTEGGGGSNHKERPHSTPLMDLPEAPPPGSTPNSRQRSSSTASPKTGIVTSV